MNVSKIETASGKLQSMSSMKQTRRSGRWSVGLLIEDVWYNAFGSEETLDKLIAGLEKGNDVNVRFKTNGKFRELLDVKPIEQGSLPPATPQLTPVKSYTVIDSDGALNIPKLKMTLKVMQDDCAFLIKELDRIGQAQEKNHSD